MVGPGVRIGGEDDEGADGVRVIVRVGGGESHYYYLLKQTSN